MAKTVKVNIDVNSDSVEIASANTLTLQQQLRVLRAELQKIPEGTKEWNLLNQKYNETRDSLERVNVKSKELFGTLSILPGPIGTVSRELDGAIDTFKIFGSIKFSDLQYQFKELGKDLKDVGATILKLTGITAVYNRTITATGATAATASTGVKALAVATSALYAALGIGVILLLVEAGKAIYNMIDPTEREAAALKKLTIAFDEMSEAISDSKKINDAYTKTMIANAKARGASQKEIDEIALKGAAKAKELASADLKNRQDEVKTLQGITDEKVKLGKKVTDEEKTALENAKKARDKATDDLRNAGVAETELVASISERKLKEGQAYQDKLKAQYEKEKEIRNAALKEIANNEKEAILSLLPERERELQKISDDYKTKIALATKYGQDTTILEEAWREALRLKKLEFTNKDYEDFEEKLAKDLDNIDKANKLKADKEIAQLNYLKETGLYTEEEFVGKVAAVKMQATYDEVERLNIEAEALGYYRGKQEEYKEAVVNINNSIRDSYFSLAQTTAQTFMQLANLFEQGSDLQKSFAIISVLINAAAAIGKVSLAATEASAEFSKTIATGTATVASGVALASNPITAIIGAAQIAAGKVAIGTGTAGLAAVKSNAVLQKVGIGVTSAAQIAAILSAKKSSGGAAVGSSGSGGGQTATPAFTTPAQAQVPQIGQSNISPEGRIGEIVMGAATEQGKRPIQTYVVGSQVTSQQQLDRRVSLSAKMGG
jgi:hypothetical protein